MPALPKREAELARPRSRKGTNQQTAKRGQLREVKIPAADSTWHPIAKRFWNALKTSGQAEFFQNSDWAFAYMLCEDITYYKGERTTRDGYAKGRSPEMLKALYAGMERLLVTEADRRKARIELHEPEPESDDATVLAIADYRADLGLDPE